MTVVRRLALVCAAIPLLVACTDDPEPSASTPTKTPSETPSETTEATTEPSTEPGAPAQDQSVLDDVTRLAPALESYSRSAGYAMSLDEAVAKLTDADLFPTEPNVVGSYVYDEADVEFRLCIESPEGEWATYDTSPMSIFESGDSGGCP